MPFGYLIGAAIFAVMTLLAVLSPRRPRPVAIAAFAVSSAVNEAPVLFLVLVTASAALTIVEGDLATPVGYVGLILNLVTVGGLCWIVVRAFSTRALVRHLPDNSRQRFTPWPSLVFWPFPLLPLELRRIRGIHYGDDRRQRLDVIVRRRPAAGGPVIVYLHGGGYFSGGRGFGGQAMLYRLARLGYVCISADYRLRPQAAFPDHLVDAKRVLAWAHENASRWGGDPDRVFAAGGSAGAHLVSICMLTMNRPWLQPGFEESDTSTVGSICLYGYYGYYYGTGPNDAPRSSPFGYTVPDELPPVLIVHGERDSYTPVEAARSLAAHLGGAGNVTYLELPFGQHNFDLFRSVRSDAVNVAVEAFVASVFERPDHGDRKTHRR